MSVDLQVAPTDRTAGGPDPVRDRPTVLIVENDEDHVELVSRAFRGHLRPYRLLVADSLIQARRVLDTEAVNLVVADHLLPDGDGADLLPDHRAEPQLPLVLMTASADHATLVDAMKRGAVDYVVKSAASLASLPDTADRALREWALVLAQRQAEKALRVSERRALSLFEHSPIALWEQDFALVKRYVDDLDVGGEGFREYLDAHPEIAEHCLKLADLIGVNQATQDLLQADTAEQLVTEFPSVITHELRECFTKALVAVRENAVGLCCETTVRTLTGELRDVHLKWAVVPGHEEDYARVLVSLSDITDRRRAEWLLEKQKAELQRSNEELQQFAYIASHDLQEPLRMISSYLQLLERRYSEHLDQDAREFIEFGVDGAKRMQKLINDLLTYSRVSTRGNRLEPVESRAVLIEAIHDLGPLIEETGAEIEYDGLPTVIADRGQLGQLFRNLLTNALRFADSAPRVRVSGREQDAESVFSVQDNGIGIAPAHLKRIFLIFQRLHSRGEYPGTGIGLAICKRIVERHQGRIWVESEVGKGTTFHFSMPLHKEEA